MKIKLILVFAAMAGLVYGGYLWGWYKGVAHEAVASAIAYGQEDLLVAKALGQRDVPEALKWTQSSLNHSLRTLRAFENRMPTQFVEAGHKFKTSIELYLQAHPGNKS